MNDPWPFQLVSQTFCSFLFYLCELVSYVHNVHKQFVGRHEEVELPLVVMTPICTGVPEEPSGRERTKNT